MIINSMTKITLFVIVFLIVLCNSRINGYGVYQNNNVTKSMFVFGDSISDFGNTKFYAPLVYNPLTHHPYGLTFFPTATGRASDGLLVPDIIAKYADLRLSLPYLHPNVSFTYGANFAYEGGAVLDQDASGNMNLPQQLDAFYKVVANWSSELGEDEAKKKLNEAVFLIELGGVDYGAFSKDSPNATEAQQQGFVELVIQTLVKAIKEMYEVGGRKFAFENVAPMGCIPLWRVKNGVIMSGDCTQFLSSKLARMHNIALPKAIKALETELSGFQYGIFDYYTTLLDMIQNPKTYGFVQGEIACCGSGMLNSVQCGEEDTPYMLCTNPSAYVLFDFAHPTQRANFILSNLFWEGSETNNATMTPYNLKQLFGLDYLHESPFSLSSSLTAW